MTRSTQMTTTLSEALKMAEKASFSTSFTIKSTDPRADYSRTGTTMELKSYFRCLVDEMPVTIVKH